MRIVIFFSVVLTLCFTDEISPDLEAKLRFYNGSMDSFKEFPLRKAQDIFKASWYDDHKDTVIFAHGFTGHAEGKAVVAVISAYLSTKSVNVALLNWDQQAAGTRPNFVNSYMNWAAPNSRKLGVEFANVLRAFQAVGFDLSKIHLVGHSLGAHIFGIAGNTLMSKGIKLSWITGLDPASTDFENRPLSVKLHANSAEYVDIVHSDPNKYGYRRSMGTVDFWPNFKTLGNVRQPGCDNRPSAMFSAADLCNHNRCWELLVDSLKYPNSVIGSQAKNYRMWRNYSPEQRRSNTLTLGYRKNNTLPGNYYFNTNKASPFGLAENGL